MQRGLRRDYNNKSSKALALLLLLRRTGKPDCHLLKKEESL
ncbi:hypothetical protein [Clostridium minihomine]|nr:hypothetical protein [Clostridium minihomine]